MDRGEREERPAFSTLPPAERYDRTTIQAIVLVTFLVIAAIGAVLLLLHPDPPKHSLSAHTLEIHEIFYPATIQAEQVDLDQARVIEWRTDARYRLVERTNGTGLPHYRAGWFRTAGGEKVLVYIADAREVVLLPGRNGGPTVLYETADPKAFLEKLKTRWGR